MTATKVVLKTLNPQGEIDTAVIKGLNPRISNLAGKTIGLYWNGKPDGDLFWDVIEKNLKKKYPKVTVLRYNGPGDLGSAMAPKIVKEVDALMYGVGD
jgi:hypothetical protein